MRRRLRSRSTETPQSGEDSFLDIISNMVGIMIILVMVAGVRVGNVSDTEETEESVQQQIPAEQMPVAGNLLEVQQEPAPSAQTQQKEDLVKKTRYIEAMKEFSRLREDGIALKTEVDELNRQMERVRNEAAGADAEYQGLIAEITAAEAAIEHAVQESSEAEQVRLEKDAELRRLTEETERLKSEAERLALVRPKATLLENMPTPMTKKVEGNEGVFALRDGKISHVPIGYFAERVRGYFRSIRDTTRPHFEEKLGPFDGYTFRFEGSLHKHRTDDGQLAMSIVFDEGEFIPDPRIGETWSEALEPDSEFRKKLGVYLRESSVITLSVYPDSFGLLRDVKKYLLENEYTIAIRPMPAGKNIVISPNGTESTTY